jgi:SAM-dependent methyltransferase
MRKTYRNKNVREYWGMRWQNVPADLPMENESVYPLCYSNQIINCTNGKILEAGCGAGRVLRYYHGRGYDIEGIDFIKEAIGKLERVDPSLKVSVGDITNLDYGSKTFDFVLAFGLYHNLDENLQLAIDETNRILRPGGGLCASFRADNVQTRISDWIERIKSMRKCFLGKSRNREFHKMNLKKHEFGELFNQSGFKVRSIQPVQNMPFLYKFRGFRSKKQKDFNENIVRSEGYKLSRIGAILQSFLMNNFPDQFCNIYVMIAYKK